MSTSVLKVAAVVLLACSATLRAEDAPLQVEVSGRLGLRGKDPAKGIVAQLRIASGRREAALEERKSLDLFASGDVAKKLQELAQQHERVKLTGALKRDGLLVQTIEMEQEKPKKEKKEKREKREKPPLPDPDQGPPKETETKEF